MDVVENIMVRKIEQLDPYTFGIEWTDGRSSQWRLAHLRRHCPCAGCIDEWTRETTLDPKSIDENIQANLVHSVGRYALNIQFSDGHSSGIFSFDLLRHLDQAGEEEPRSGRKS